MWMPRGRLLFLMTSLAPLLWKAGAIDWGDTTSSTSEEEFFFTAPVGEIITIVLPEGERARIEFISEPSDHFAVSYRQCSENPGQPLQIQYAEKLQHTPYVGGCLYAENEVAGIGDTGCTFWQYNPAENWMTDGIVVESSDTILPGIVRFENRGNANATVDIAMFSKEIPPPVGLADKFTYVEDSFSKQDRIVNTSVNVFFNDEEAYCEQFGCVVSGWVNDHIEGQESLSLCEVQATGEMYYEEEDFDTYIPLVFELPEDGEYYVTLILSARPHKDANLTEMQEFGLDEIVVFQTDTSLPDSSARLFARASMLTLAWLVLINTVLAQVGKDYVAGAQQVVPALGW